MPVCGVTERASGQPHGDSRRAPARGPGHVLALLVCLLATWSAQGQAQAVGPGETGRFALHKVEVRRVDNVYWMDAIGSLDLSPRVRDALYGGVRLTIALEVEIQRARSWWFDSDVAEVSQRHTLELHELSGQYVVTNLSTGERQSFYRLRSALDAIGRAIGVPIIDAVLIDDPAAHYGRARLRLQREALPWALRPAALIHSGWDLESSWVEWSFD